MVLGVTGIGLICEIAAEGGYESRLFRIGTVERISEQELGHRQRDDRRKCLLTMTEIDLTVTVRSTRTTI